MNGIFIQQQQVALENLGHRCQVVQTYKWFPRLGLHKFHPYWKEGYLKYNDFFKSDKLNRIHKIPIFVKMPDRFFKDDPYQREANAIYKYFKRRKLLDQIDLIYANFYTETAYVGTFLKQLTGKPLVSIARGDDVHAWPQENPLLLKHIEKVFEFSDKLLANSKRLAHDAEKLILGHSREVQVVYNGIDTEKFKPISLFDKQKLVEKLKLPADKKLLLCVATPVKLKGWIELFEAIANNSTSFKDWVLICVAPTRNFPDRIDLLAEAEAKGIGNKTIVVGQVPHSNLVEFYQASDAFVLASYNEGLANVVLEAAATNLPLLVTDVGGHREVFENSKSTLLFTPKDPNELTESLKKFLNYQASIPSDTRKVVSVQVGNYKKNAKRLVSYFEEALG